MMESCLLSTRFSSLSSQSIRKIRHLPTGTELRTHTGKPCSPLSSVSLSQPSSFSSSLLTSRCFSQSSPCRRGPLSASTTPDCRLLSFSPLQAEDGARSSAERNRSLLNLNKDCRIFFSNRFSSTSSTFSSSSVSRVCVKEEGLRAEKKKKSENDLFVFTLTTLTRPMMFFCRRFSTVADKRQITRPSDSEASQQERRPEEGERRREEENLERSTRLKRLMYRAKQVRRMLSDRKREREVRCLPFPSGPS